MPNSLIYLGRNLCYYLRWRPLRCSQLLVEQRQELLSCMFFFPHLFQPSDYTPSPRTASNRPQHHSPCRSGSGWLRYLLISRCGGIALGTSGQVSQIYGYYLLGIRHILRPWSYSRRCNQRTLILAMGILAEVCSSGLISSAQLS